MKPCVTDTENLLNIEDQLCFALYSTSRAITKEYAVLLEEMGITYPQYLTLMILWKSDGLLIQEIAAGLEVDQATVTPLVKRLEKMQLVSRQRSTEDERKVHVFLTEEGKAMYKSAIEVPHGLGCAIGVQLEEAAALIAELNKIKSFIKTRTSSQG